MLRLLAPVASVAAESQLFYISGITGITSVGDLFPHKIEACRKLVPQTNDDHLVLESPTRRYLHRKEDDQDNAAYWYGRAGKPVCRDV
jgi:hypothetical protein